MVSIPVGQRGEEKINILGQDKHCMFYIELLKHELT